MWLSLAFLETIWHDCTVPCLLLFRCGLQSDKSSSTFEKRFQCFCFHSLLCLWRKTDNLQQANVASKPIFPNLPFFRPHLIGWPALLQASSEQDNRGKQKQGGTSSSCWHKRRHANSLWISKQASGKHKCLFPQILWPEQLQTIPKSISKHCLLMSHLALEVTGWHP